MAEYTTEELETIKAILGPKLDIARKHLEDSKADIYNDVYNIIPFHQGVYDRLRNAHDTTIELLQERRLSDRTVQRWS